VTLCLLGCVLQQGQRPLAKRMWPIAVFAVSCAVFSTLSPRNTDCVRYSVALHEFDCRYQSEALIESHGAFTALFLLDALVVIKQAKPEHLN
jgi:hypothetical protein